VEDTLEEQSLYSSEEESETSEEEEAMKKEEFLTMVNTVTDGKQLLDIITLLPNTAQCWGHSITMNPIIKLLCCASLLKEQCKTFLVVMVKKGVLFFFLYMLFFGLTSLGD
jgi:hypothetical protein